MTLLATIPLEYAITDDLLLLAIGDGERSRASLRGVLDAKASGTPTELPAEAKAHMAAAPAGWCGVGMTRPAETMAGLAKAMSEAAAMGGEDDADAGQLGMIGSVLEAVAGEMKRLGIDTWMAFVYSGPQSIGYRLRW